jgi:uncharacterized protein YndB with AHSA1/START domain
MNMVDFVTRETSVSADSDTVWAALTDPAQIARWFGDSAEVDLRVGGAVRFGWPAGEISRGVVIALEPGSRWVFRWDVFGSIDDPGLFTVVELTLRPEGSRTVVRVTESGLQALADAGVAPDLEELIEEHVDGWRNEIGDLAAYLEARVTARSEPTTIEPRLLESPARPTLG